MRVVRLILLGLLVYCIAMVVLFPAAPVVEKFKPQLQPMVLNGVSGKLYKGEVESVVSTDDLLPLVLNNVKWAIAPSKLLQGTGVFRYLLPPLVEKSTVISKSLGSSISSSNTY